MSKVERLEGKVAIITGGASGMGRASVRRFLDEGAIVVAADIQQELLDTLEIPADRGFASVTDVTDGDAVKALVDDTVDRYGRLDVYFNNAGTAMWATPISDVSRELWDLTIEVNLTAAFIAAQVTFPAFRRNGGGSFLVTASTAGLRPRPNLTAYNAAKFGVIGLTKSLALDGGADNIRCNAICPVAANTPMLEQFGYGTHEETAAMLTGGNPIQRMAEPEDVANMAAYLASDDASFLTGTVVTVDGGRTI
jgi:3-oxoacyl-[acyl-carrier protein] reductase